MAVNVNWAQSGKSGRHWQTQETSRHVLLDTAQLTALGLPNDGTEKFATIVYLANPISLSAGDITLDPIVQIKGPNEEIAPVSQTRGLKVDIQQEVIRTTTNGLVSSYLAIPGPGSLGTLTGSISGVATKILLFDSITVPNDGAIPIFSFSVNEDESFSFDYGTNGLPLSSGLVVVSSHFLTPLSATYTPNFLAITTYW
jgi:hypothetical protein